MTLPVTEMTIASLQAALASSKVADTQAGSGSGGFLKFDFKTGDWSFGRDMEGVTGDTVLINTAAIKHGWVLWNDRKASKIMVPFNEELPEPMPSIGSDTPTEGRAVSGAFMDDSDTPEQFQFETNSYGGRGAVNALLTLIKTRAVTGNAFLFPAVTLGSDSYVNKRHGSTIHNPLFNIVSWHDQNGASESEQIAPTAEPTPEPEAEPTPPPRRRRRAAATA